MFFSWIYCLQTNNNVVKLIVYLKWFLIDRTVDLIQFPASRDYFLDCSVPYMVENVAYILCQTPSLYFD